LRFLVLQHEAASPPSLFADWSRERGHFCDVVDVPKLGSWREFGDFDAVVSLGSDTSVARGGEGWIASELAFLRTAHQRGTPVLGICFGGQALAAALGGGVRRADFVEVGWSRIVDPVLPLIDEGPWFRWHEDVFSVPPGAQELARSPAGPLAFSVGTAVGLQIHPEATKPLVEAWLAGARERMVEMRLDEMALRREIDAAAPGARERAFSLFDRVEQQWRRTGLPADHLGFLPSTGRMRPHGGNQ
jgi:GMP synthase-like glutamine amidotransferase